MPQLNPAPWLMTLIMLWMIIMLLLKPTLLSLRPMNPPTSMPVLLDSDPWTWLWH